MIGKVNIHGHIGESYIDAQGQLHKGTVLLDVIEQVESFPQATVLEVSVNSPGGYADIGDDIYNYLTSLKKSGKQIITIQTGLIGSIATKIFLAGDRRIVDDRYKFWIHNPYLDNVSGDQDQLREMAQSLEETEKNLRKFYAEYTSITDEGLDGLMKIETGLTADQCIKFNFGTEKKLVPVFNSIKTMSKKDEKSLEDKIRAALGLTEKPKGVVPKAQIPENPATQTMVVVLAEGAGSFWVEGELAEGSPAFLLDEAGQPTQEAVPDGDYMLEDGTSVSVAAGMVSAVSGSEAPEADMISKAEAEKMVQDALAAAKAEHDEALSAIKEETKEEIKNQILALKKDVKLGIAPKPAVFGGQPKVEFKSIADRMKEGQEKRKQQLNRN